jgi:hypothetical protein
MSQAGWARGLASSLLAEPVPRRWAHSEGVARQADRLAGILGTDADLVAAAAWLHDIGYSPALVRTGFHPLDGARYLRDIERANDRLCRLVAHHSCAAIEAARRGLRDELLAEFAPEREELTQALIYCDMTTDPDGRQVSFDTRLAEIRSRYGEDDIVSKSMEVATPRIRQAISAVERQLAD